MKNKEKILEEIEQRISSSEFIIKNGATQIGYETQVLRNQVTIM